MFALLVCPILVRSLFRSLGFLQLFLSIFIEGQLNLCKDVANKNTAIIVDSSVFNRFGANLYYLFFVKRLLFV